jgi:Flp pilus assembly protein TadD
VQIGPYETTCELARGAQGVVYRALDPEREREVALKVMLGIPRGGQARRFAREVRSLGRLQHPGIVRLFDAGEHDGLPFLCLELVEGEDLSARIRRQGQLAVDDALDLAAQLARALDHAHAQGVIHRDVKPSNVLVTVDGITKLTDFGLVRDLDPTLDASRLSKTGAFMGTPGYWSPEQATGRLDAIGPRSDVYGVGATLYCMLTGGPPVELHSLAQAVYATEIAPPPPSSHRAEIPARVDAICARCLAPEPSDRYADAAELARALEAARDGHDPQRPRAALAAAGGLVALGVLAAGAVLAGRAPSAPPALPPSASPSAVAASPTPSAAPLLPLPGPELPTEPDPLFEEAWVRVALGTQTEALEQRLTLALEGAPDHAGLLALRGLCRVARLEASGLDLLDRARGLDPWDARVQLCLGESWRRLGHLFRARAASQLAVEFTPDSAAAQTLHATLQPTPARALEGLERALALDPRFLPARFHRALNQPDDPAAARERAQIREAAPHLAVPLFSEALELREADPDGALLAFEGVLARTDAVEHVRTCLNLSWPLSQDPQRRARAEAYARSLIPRKLALVLALAERGELAQARSQLDALRLEGGPDLWAARAAIELLSELPFQAEAELAKALTEAPRHPLGLLTRARIRLSKGDPRGARDDLRAVAGMEQSPYAALAEQILTGAADALPADEPSPGPDPDALARRCEIADSELLVGGDVGWALRTYQAVLAVAADLPRALAGQAAARAQLGDPAARVELARAVALAPDDPRVLVHRSLALPTGASDDALALLAPLLERWPDEPRLRLESARHLIGTDPDRALRELNRAVSAGSVDALLTRSRWERGFGVGADAGEDTRRAVELAPWSARAHMDYAAWALQAERYEDAHAAYVEASRLEPTMPAPWRQRARLVAWWRDDDEEAARWLRRAASLGDTSAELHWALADALQGVDPSQAVAVATRAVLLMPSADSRATLAKAYLAAGRTEQAAGLADALRECRELPQRLLPTVDYVRTKTQRGRRR